MNLRQVLRINEPPQVGDVVRIHSDQEIVLFRFRGCYEPRSSRRKRNAHLPEFGACAVMDVIADLIGVQRSGLDLNALDTGLTDKVLHNELRHRASADIAMT